MSRDAYRLPPSAEFPHDNPALFEGARWVVVRPCDSPRPLARARTRDLHYPAPAAAPKESQLAAIAAPVPGRPLAEAEPAPDATGDLERFIAVLVSVASRAGATRLAVELKTFFEGGALRLDALPEASQQSLVASRLASLSADGPVLAPRAVATARAWQRTLAGLSQDFAECGDTTLDAWAAEFVGACLGFDPARVQELRRALRRQGVAAFGMLAA